MEKGERGSREGNGRLSECKGKEERKKKKERG